MRNLSIIFLLLLAVTVFGMGPEYFSSRKWIEEHSKKSKFEEKLFVGEAKQTTNTYILQYRDGISLREIIDATRLKNTEVKVTVLRSQKKTEPVFDDVVKASAKPSFRVNKDDVIWLSTFPYNRN
jgi:hypothetical protein